ncbi:MAG: hypothetical protein QCH31_10995 [Methanolobus sp.]|nr:hypothetical protein [Methanolobus sp.]
MILAICLCIFFCGVADADIPSFVNLSEIKSNISIGKPVYKLYSYSKYIETDEENEVQIEYFLTGVGQVNANKIRISVPPAICKDANVTYQTIEGNHSEIESGQYEGKLETRLYPNEGAQLGGWLPPYYFTMDKENSIFNYGGKPWQRVNNTISVVSYSDSKASMIAPITVSFTIEKDAPKGDYEILFFVFYEYGNVWYSTQESVTVHIKHWYEQWYYQILLALSVPIIYAILSSVYKYIYKISTSAIKEIAINFSKLLILIKKELKKLNLKKRVKNKQKGKRK